MEKEKLTQLVTKMQNGDREAASELYLECRDELYYYILKTVNDTHLAEDLLQDTFMEILQTIDKLNAPEAFVTWSRQIAYHRCTGYFRKHKELLADENEDGQTVFDTIEEDREEFIPDAALDKEDLKLTIAQMISELPEEQRSTLILRYYDELSLEEIAKVQDIPLGTVKSRLTYSRKALKSTVEAYEKKHGIKLHSVAILPLLLWFFREKAIAEGASLTAKGTAAASAAAATTTTTAAATASTTAAAGSAAAAGAAKAVAVTGAKAATTAAAKGVATKIIAGILAASLVVGGGVVALNIINHDDDSNDSSQGDDRNDKKGSTNAPQNGDNNGTDATQSNPNGGNSNDGEQEPLPEAQPLALPEAGSVWEGFGSHGQGERWYDMTLTGISDTQVSGNLKISIGATVNHETAFTGTGTEEEGVITYQVTFETPHKISLGMNRYREVTATVLTYDRNTQLFALTEEYEVKMQNKASIVETILDEGGSWRGMGSDNCNYSVVTGNNNLFQIQITHLSSTRIVGHLTLSYQGKVNHDTDFEGRCTGVKNGVYRYDVVLEIPRRVEYMISTFTVEVLDFFIKYNSKEQTLELPALQTYTCVLEKENPERLETAKNLIAQGEYQQAFDWLSAIENPTEEEAALLGCFVFKPVQEISDSGETRTYFYDEGGNCISDERVTASGVRFISYYDETGKIVTKKTIDGDKTAEYTNIYDEAGNIIEHRRKRSDGQWVTTNVFTYDAHGNWLTQEIYGFSEVMSPSSPEPTAVITYSHTYDRNGNLLTTTTKGTALNSNAGETLTKYTYNEKGQCIKEENYQDGVLKSSTEHTYEQSGLKSYSVTTNASGEESKTTYHYALFYIAPVQ